MKQNYQLVAYKTTNHLFVQCNIKIKLINQIHKTIIILIFFLNIFLFYIFIKIKLKNKILNINIDIIFLINIINRFLFPPLNKLINKMK